MRRRGVAAVLFVLASAAPLFAQDSLFVNLSLAHLESLGDDGAGVEVDWLHEVSPAILVDLGGSHFYLDGVHWTYGRTAVAWRNPHDVLFAQIELGAGTATGDRFGFQKYRTGATHTLRESELFVDLELQHADIMQIQETSLRAGGAWLPHRNVILRLHGTTSLHGDTDTRFADARLDWTIRPYATVFAGGSTGRSNNTTTALIGPISNPQREFFLGATIRDARLETTVTFVRTVVAGIERNTLVVGWKIPLPSS